MDFNQWTQLFELLVSFLQIIIWPLVVLIILFYVRTPLKRFLDDLIEVNLKAGPIETTAKRKQIIEVAMVTQKVKTQKVRWLRWNLLSIWQSKPQPVSDTRETGGRAAHCKSAGRSSALLVLHVGSRNL